MISLGDHCGSRIQRMPYINIEKLQLLLYKWYLSNVFSINALVYSVEIFMYFRIFLIVLF